MLITAYSLLIVFLGTLLLISSRRYWVMTQAKRDGKIAKGKPTMFDVRQLLMEGKKELAIEVYCAIFNTSPSRSKKDVEELQRSLKV